MIDFVSPHSLLFVQQPGTQLTAKLTDFGMAKVRAAANNTTNIDTRKGTVAWQPPGALRLPVHTFLGCFVYRGGGQKGCGCV